MGKLTKQFLILFLVFVALAAILSNVSTPWESKSVKEVAFNTLIKGIENGEIKELTLSDGGEIRASMEKGEELKTYNIGGDSLVTTLKEYGISKETLKNLSIKVKPKSGFSNFLSVILPILLPFLLLGGLLYFFYRQAQGMSNKTLSFGSSAGKQVNMQKEGENKGGTKTTFRDIAGAREAKEELMEVIEFLKNPKKFTDLGARIPRGVLLIGPPGCGKTLLAKAVAGEAEVPFFHISGSEFMEMFVGVGASRVRGLFQKAKRNAPCIIFIDELDSIGRKRGGGFGGSHDERDQTLNQILVEMDGFETDVNVIVMAATNRPDVLDTALLRPGRFDRRVNLDLPDIADREEILHVHGKGKPLAKDINIKRIAQRTPGFSGADLSNLMNEAAILTARRNKKQISMDEVLPSIEKVLLGPERKSKVLGDEEKKITAYHEAGHALVAHILPNTDPVHKISIIARGQAGGYTLKVPEKDKHLHTRAEFIDDLAVFMGGLASERLIFKEITTGASGDLMSATRLARRIVTHYGMSEKIGPVSFGKEEINGYAYPWEEPSANYSDNTLKKIDEEIAEILKLAYNKSEEVIQNNKEKLQQIAEKLLKQETIEKEEFDKMMSADK